MAATLTKKNDKSAPKVQPLNITISPINRQSSDISVWKRALNNFCSLTNPNRVLFYNLIEDIILDGQIEAVWSKRVDAIANTPLIFSKDGKQDDKINRLLASPDMINLIKDIHSTVAYGYTLIQIRNIIFSEYEEQYHIDYEVIDRKHVHPEKDFECVSIMQNQATKDFLYKEKPLSDYMLYMGQPNDKGLFFKAAQYVIYKRGGFGDWAQFTECFGMPFREMTYDEFDEATRIKMEKLLKEWGAFGYMLHPKGSELTLHPASNAGSCPFPDLIAFCDASISKCILGNTLTTEQGSTGTQALGNVHLQVEEAKHLADKMFVLSVLNTQFKAILKRFGFAVQDGNIWFEAPQKDWTKLQTKWNVISGIASRIPIADDYIYEEFDIPKPDNYDELKQELQERQSIGLGIPNNQQQNALPPLDFFV